ncbi:PE family protein [Mycobacterium camsae]|uniref:PE family protein n=1 Tax=Mycobacterium gordonae TaxID=1778 RepID=UPI001980BC4B|nr:PE family protein [Mycobacterium gordonae]
MSWFVAGPEAMAAAASDLSRIGSTIGESNTAAVQQTTGVPASAADQVSAAIATFWDAHAQGYQHISAQMSTFHDQFVQALTAGGAAYARAEEAADASLRSALNAPVRDLLGPPA